MSGQDVLTLVPGRKTHEDLQRAINASARRQSVMRDMRFGCLVAAGLVAKRDAEADPQFPCGYDERDAQV